MTKYSSQNIFRFYFITDDAAPTLTPMEQVRIALDAGATLIQYRNKSFDLARYPEAHAIRHLCRRRATPFIVNDHVLLAKALDADGVHLGQEDASPALVRDIMGREALVGLSVSNLKELAASDPAHCDYIGTGPIFATGTKADAKAVRGLSGLRKMVLAASPLPVVGIGGITAENAPDCFRQGAAGVAVISCISRSASPEEAARRFAAACAWQGGDPHVIP